MSTKMFTSAGITLHSRDAVSVNKVRFGTDHVRMIKMLGSSKKIGVSYNFGGRDDGYLDPKRVDIVELPNAMSKQDATKYLLAHADFQSPADQALLQEALGSREPKAPRVKKEKVVKAKKSEMSLDSIKSRAKKQVSAEEILDQIAAE
jgi:hypothetical protein